MAVMAIGMAAAYLAPVGYASLAYAVASTAATMLLSKKTTSSQEGSRLQDLKVSTSSYGTGVPLVFGTTRMAGNMIWSTDLIESKHVDTQSQGGKGGGGEVTSTSYTYSVNCAFLLCEGEISGVKKIWADGKLVYDIDATNQGYIGDVKTKLKVYNGTETQLPDPTIESIEGVGNVEAYRGLAYVVFTNLQLAEFGNRIPSFSFEVIRTKEIVLESNSYIENLTVGAGGQEWTGVGANGIYYNNINKTILLQTISSDYGIVKYNPFNSTIESYDFKNNQDAFRWFSFGGSNTNIDFTIDGNIIKAGMVNNVLGVGLIDGDTLQLTNFYDENNFKIYGDFKYGFKVPKKYVYINKFNIYIGLHYNDTYSDRGNLFALIFNEEFKPMNYTELSFTKRTKSNYDNGFYYNRKTSIGQDVNSCFCVDQKKTKLYYCVFQESNNSTFPSGVDQRRILSLSSVNIETGNHSEEFQYLIADNQTGSLKIFGMEFDELTRSILLFVEKNNEKRLIKFNVDTSSIVFDIFLSGNNKTIEDKDGIVWNIGDYVNQWTVNQYSRKVFFQYNYYNSKFGTVAIDIDKGFIDIWATEITNGPNPNSYNNLCFIPEISSLISVSSSFDGGASIIKNIGKRFTNGNYKLSDAVKELSTRSGLDESYIDVSDLENDFVNGYIVANSTTIRGCLEQLAQVFNFDIVETDYKIKFVKCGKQSIKTIEYDNLSCNSYSPDVSFSNDIVIKRTQELELPKLLNLTYLDIDNDYQQNTQDSVRETVKTKEIINVSIPLSMRKDDAKKIAERLLYSFWTQRDSYTFETNYDYIELEPCDIVNVKTTTELYTIKITKKEEDAGIIRFSGVRENSKVYNQIGIGGTQSNQKQTIAPLSTTKTIFLDIPAIRNVDIDQGFYVSVSRQSKNMKWNGSVLYNSNEQFGSYNILENFTNDSTNGSTKIKLGDFTLGNVIDYINTIDVIVINGELQSISEDSFLSGGNTCVIGNEIINFKNAELIGESTYRLSTLLRGRWNTENFINQHNQGDRFILMDSSSIKRIKSDISSLNSTMYYKNVSNGKYLNDTSTNVFKNSMVSLKCYPVTDVQSNRDFDGNIYCSFKPRIRGDGVIIDDIEIFDPDGDYYEIEILDDYGTNIIKRIIKVNFETSFIYNKEDQLKDFGMLKNSVNINIYKLNSIIGRGYKKIAII